MPSGLRGVEATIEGEKKKKYHRGGKEDRRRAEARASNLSTNVSLRIALLAAFWPLFPRIDRKRGLFRGEETGDRALDRFEEERRGEGFVLERVESKTLDKTSVVTLSVASPSTGCVI